jgi:hypothetical protein
MAKRVLSRLRLAQNLGKTSTQIQSAYRMNTCRRRFQRTRRSCVRIQGRTRGYLVRVDPAGFRASLAAAAEAANVESLKGQLAQQKVSALLKSAAAHTPHLPLAPLAQEEALAAEAHARRSAARADLEEAARDAALTPLLLAIERRDWAAAVAELKQNPDAIKDRDGAQNTPAHFVCRVPTQEDGDAEMRLRVLSKIVEVSSGGRSEGDEARGSKRSGCREGSDPATSWLLPERHRSWARSRKEGAVALGHH